MENVHRRKLALGTCILLSTFIGCSPQRPSSGPVTVHFIPLSPENSLRAVLGKVQLEDLKAPSNAQTLAWLSSEPPKNLKSFGLGYAGFFQAIYDCEHGALDSAHSFMGLLANEYDHTYAATYFLITENYSSTALTQDSKNAKAFFEGAKVPAKDSPLGYFLLSRSVQSSSQWIDPARDILRQGFNLYPQNPILAENYAEACETGLRKSVSGNGQLVPVLEHGTDRKTAIKIRKALKLVGYWKDQNTDRLCEDLNLSGQPEEAKSLAQAFLRSHHSKYQDRNMTKLFEKPNISELTTLSRGTKSFVYDFPLHGKDPEDYLVSDLLPDGSLSPPHHYRSLLPKVGTL